MLLSFIRHIIYTLSIESQYSSYTCYDGILAKLYDRHKGSFNVSSIRGGNYAKLNKAQEETVNVMLSMYGGMSGVALSRLTHQEPPWREARQKARLGLGERGSAKIDLDRMAEFYSSLYIEDGEETEEQE